MRKRLSIVVAPESAEAGGLHLMITKGAFDNVLAVFTQQARGRHRCRWTARREPATKTG